MTILLENVLKNNVINLEELLSSGHNPDACDENGYSLLHWACQEGFVEVVKILKKYNANINIVDINGMTPLFNSSGSGDFEIVELLIHLGADINYSTGLGSALHNACAYEDIEIIDILLKRALLHNVFVLA